MYDYYQKALLKYLKYIPKGVDIHIFPVVMSG